MYKCDICGAVMDNLPIHRERNWRGEFFEEFESYSCPFCESPYISEFDPYEGGDYDG